MTRVTLTAVVCTRNRAHLLRDALAILQDQAASLDGVSLLVVDNGSSDSTPLMLDAAAADDPRLRWVREETPGLSAARNRALQEVTTDIVLFTDDDVLPDPGWLSTASQCFSEAPDLSALGGPVDLETEIPIPGWLTTELQQYLARCDFGPTPRVLTLPDYPVGANMAFRTSDLRDAGGFSDGLGHVLGKLRGCEEAAAFIQLARLGAQVRYEPTFRVRHRIPTHRLTRGFLMRRLFGEGCSRVALTRLVGPEWGTYTVHSSLVNGLMRRKRRALRELLRNRSRRRLDEEMMASAFHLGVLWTLFTDRP
jgi:glycosyltransferase involved in cell wall biosynthesis